MLIFLGIVIFIVVLWFFACYNSMVSARNAVERALASIDAALKQRHDLLPNAIATVKAFMNHEKDLLTEVTRLRSQLGNEKLTDADRTALESTARNVLGKVMVTVEQYPELRSNSNFLQLQRTIQEVEEEIYAARRSYTANIAHYNTSIQKLPEVFLARLFGFLPMAQYEITEAERENVDVAAHFKK